MVYEKLQNKYNNRLYDIYLGQEDTYDCLMRLLDMAYDVVDEEIDKEQYREGDGLDLEDLLEYKRSLEDLEYRISRDNLDGLKTNPYIRDNFEEIARLLAIELVLEPAWVYDRLVELVADE